ncbi:P-loop containing nucleoside triphosphate hydrolase protein [Lenzites betulinus]|nr:P-loop containing nucleoside triphosphate hydrolase protein [Lenzites betulinus]
MSTVGESGAAPAPADLPDIPEIRRRTAEKLGREPCLWQCEVALAVLKGDNDIVCVSATGSGKTLTFWIPLLFRPEGIQLVITPLNLLGSQNRQQLDALGIRALAISGENANVDSFRAAATLPHGAVMLNPEVAFKNKLSFDWLWRNAKFTSRLVSVVWDEAHCIKAWGSFRPSLAESGNLRNMLPPRVPYLMPSATFTKSVSTDVISIVQARRDRMLYIRRSNDRPNVFLTVRKMQYAVSSYRDLDFLIPDGWTPQMRIRPFVVFFDNIEDSINATEALRKRLPREYSDRIVWFNSDNTSRFREQTTEAFREHNILGLFCTDSFGMGVDIPSIEIVVQWKATCDLDALWQRFGRAARGSGMEGLAVLLVEPKYFDDEKASAMARAQKRRDADARKASQKEASKRKRADTTTGAGSGRAGNGKKTRTSTAAPGPSPAEGGSLAIRTSRVDVPVQSSEGPAEGDGVMSNCRHRQAVARYQIGKTAARVETKLRGLLH